VCYFADLAWGRTGGDRGGEKEKKEKKGILVNFSLFYHAKLFYQIGRQK
jgi:hypothetical protein